jgi:hypothetical protein
VRNLGDVRIRRSRRGGGMVGLGSCWVIKKVGRREKDRREVTGDRRQETG